MYEKPRKRCCGLEDVSKYERHWSCILNSIGISDRQRERKGFRLESAVGALNSQEDCEGPGPLEMKGLFGELWKDKDKEGGYKYKWLQSLVELTLWMINILGS